MDGHARGISALLRGKRDVVSNGVLVGAHWLNRENHTLTQNPAGTQARPASALFYKTVLAMLT